MVGMGIFILAMVVTYYTDLLALSYDEEFARIRGVPVTALYFMLIGMLAVTVVMVIQVVGLILVIALLTIPPFIMEGYARSMLTMMIGSSLLGALFTVSGLWISYFFDLTSGASIILVAGFFFFLNLLVQRRVNARKQSPLVATGEKRPAVDPQRS
jgi:zinc transport system permease protein